jgi:2-methylisocitrate lyase-like PEP mutase family enzyme
MSHSAATAQALRARFAELHESGTFVMPNAFDVGSARVLTAMGFEAIATSSSGHAASLGRHDQQVFRDELVEHVAALSAAVDIPLSVDSERCFADDVEEIAETVAMLAEAGAAGFSIEDYRPDVGIDPLGEATDRVAAAAAAARAHGLVLTARAENHLYGTGDLADTLERLAAYREAGADCLYAPGLRSPEDIAEVVALGLPANVLIFRGAPTVAELTGLGVRRVSTGGAMAFAAYGAVAAGARELLTTGTSFYTEQALSAEDRNAAFS